MWTPVESSKKFVQERTNRQIMSYIALFASILGAAVLTVVSCWIIYIVWQGGWPVETAAQRISILSKGLMLSLGGSIIVLITFGFVISRRTIKISREGVMMQSEEPEDDATQEVIVNSTVEVKNG